MVTPPAEVDGVHFGCLYLLFISLPSRVFTGNLKKSFLVSTPPTPPQGKYSVTFQEYAWLVISFGKTWLLFFSILSEPSIHAFRVGLPQPFPWQI